MPVHANSGFEKLRVAKRGAASPLPMPDPEEQFRGNRFKIVFLADASGGLAVNPAWSLILKGIIT